MQETDFVGVVLHLHNSDDDNGRGDEKCKSRELNGNQQKNTCVYLMCAVIIGL